MVTNLDAYDTQYQHIPQDPFDEQFLNMNGIEIIKQTSPKFNRGNKDTKGGGLKI